MFENRLAIKPGMAVVHELNGRRKVTSEKLCCRFKSNCKRTITDRSHQMYPICQEVGGFIIPVGFDELHQVHTSHLSAILYALNLLLLGPPSYIRPRDNSELAPLKIWFLTS